MKKIIKNGQILAEIEQIEISSKIEISPKNVFKIKLFLVPLFVPILHAPHFSKTGWDVSKGSQPCDLAKKLTMARTSIGEVRSGMLSESLHWRRR